MDFHSLPAARRAPFSRRSASQRSQLDSTASPHSLRRRNGLNYLIGNETQHVLTQLSLETGERISLSKLVGQAEEKGQNDIVFDCWPQFGETELELLETAGSGMYAAYTMFEKQHENRTTLETTLIGKRRIQYELQMYFAPDPSPPNLRRRCSTSPRPRRLFLRPPPILERRPTPSPLATSQALLGCFSDLQDNVNGAQAHPPTP